MNQNLQRRCYSGFRFPIAQWPSANCTPSDLFHLFWEGVLKMLEIGFEYVNQLLFFIVNFQINGNNKYNYTATECGLFMLKPVHLHPEG